MSFENTQSVERIVKRVAARQKRRLTKRLLQQRIYKNHDGRDLYELSILELQKLLYKEVIK